MAGDLIAGFEPGTGGVPPTRQVIAGTGLSGGGPLSADVTLSLAGGGGGLQYTDLTWDPALDGQLNASGVEAASYTTGWIFVVTRADLAGTGVKVWWGGSAAVTLVCCLRAANGTVLGTASVTTAGAGMYTATFAEPLPLTIGATYQVTCYESTGASIAAGDFSSATRPAKPIPEPGIILISGGYASGNTFISAQSYWPPVAPVLGGGG